MKHNVNDHSFKSNAECYKLAVVTIGFALFAIASTTVSAKIVKENHAGATCVSIGNGQIAYDSHGAVFNLGKGGMQIKCPIPHTDFDSYFNSGEIDRGWFRAVDLNEHGDIRCRFRSSGINNTGGVNSRIYYAQYSEFVGTKGFGTAAQHVNLKGVSEQWNSHYVLTCHLPGSSHHGYSKLFTYQVRE